MKEMTSQTQQNQAFLRAYVTGNMDEYYAQYPVNLDETFEKILNLSVEN